MRIIILAVSVVLLAGFVGDAARADPYRWCAEYSGGGGGSGGGTNCYFLTIEQCQAQVSGIGGFCRPNLFYDGRPVVTPEEMTAPRHRKR